MTQRYPLLLLLEVAWENEGYSSPSAFHDCSRRCKRSEKCRYKIYGTLLRQALESCPHGTPRKKITVAVRAGIRDRGSLRPPANTHTARVAPSHPKCCGVGLLRLETKERQVHSGHLQETITETILLLHMATRQIGQLPKKQPFPPQAIRGSIKSFIFGPVKMPGKENVSTGCSSSRQPPGMPLSEAAHHLKPLPGDKAGLVAPGKAACGSGMAPKLTAVPTTRPWRGTPILLAAEALCTGIWGFWQLSPLPKLQFDTQKVEPAAAHTLRRVTSRRERRV